MPPKKVPSRKAAGTSQKKEPSFESDRAMELLEAFYPTLLENCVDSEDEVDTRAAFELLAAMTGLFFADYHNFYGQEKTMEAFQEFVDLSLMLYSERAGEEEE